MVKVFFIPFSCAAADSFSFRIVAPNAAAARNSRRLSVSFEMRVLGLFLPSAAAGFLREVFIWTLSQLNYGRRNAPPVILRQSGSGSQRLIGALVRRRHRLHHAVEVENEPSRPVLFFQFLNLWIAA
jgi:hypothetical protein